MTGGNLPVSVPVPVPGGSFPAGRAAPGVPAMPATPIRPVTPVTSRKYRKQGMS